jgi:predicted Zn-dependent protease
MKFYITVIALVLSGCATTEAVVKQEIVNPQAVKVIEKEIIDIEPVGIHSIVSNKALHTYNNEYRKAKLHKAMVQSVTGSWSWKSNRTSKKHAVKSALISCQKYNEKHEDLYPCQVINIDGEWVNK